MTPDYINSLIRTESGGNWAAQNSAMGAGGKAGHFGRLQFGRARLEDAMRAGAIPQGTTPEQFMASPDLQMAAERWHFADLERQLAPLVGSVVNGQKLDMAALVAMGHLGGAGGARRYVESGGRYNPSDVFGTSLSDYARTHGGAGGASMGGQTMQMSTQNARPTGLLGAMPEEQRAGLFGLLGGNRPAWADKANDIGAVLLALSGSPAAQPLLEMTRERKRSKREDARMNRTVEWLASQGRADLAEAVAGGVMPAADAARIVLTPAEAPRGVVVGGNIVDPVTGSIIYQGPEKPPEMSATERDIALLGEIGVPRDEAIRILQLNTVSRDPVTGEAVILDRRTGQPISGAAQPATTTGGASAAPQEVMPPPAVDEFGQPYPSAPLSFGLGGAARNIANVAGDVTGLGTPFPEVQQSMADFAVLQEKLINDVASAYDRQPPSWLLQNIRALTPQAGSVFTGPDAAVSQLDALGRDLAAELRNTEMQLNERLSPADRELLRKRRVALSAGLDRVRTARNAMLPQTQPVTIAPDIEERLRAYE